MVDEIKQRAALEVKYNALNASALKVGQTGQGGAWGKSTGDAVGGGLGGSGCGRCGLKTNQAASRGRLHSRPAMRARIRRWQLGIALGCALRC